jgi:hypothetical protein
MKKLIAKVLSGLGIAALLTLVAIFIGAREPDAEQTSDPSLNITVRTSEEIAGTLSGTPSDVAFEARMKTPLIVSVQVRVNDLVLDASAELGEDGQKQLVVIDGYGKALSPEDKKALIELSGRLEHYLDPYRRQVPPHEDLLARTVGLWAEAPVGYPLTRQEIRPSNNP